MRRLVGIFVMAFTAGAWAQFGGRIAPVQVAPPAETHKEVLVPIQAPRPASAPPVRFVRPQLAPAPYIDTTTITPKPTDQNRYYTAAGLYPEIGLASRVRVLIVADEYAENIGDTVRSDGDHVYEYFDTVFRKNPNLAEFANRITIDCLGGGGVKVTPQMLMNYYARLQTSPTETLVFYYSGHGKANSVGANVLQMSGGEVPRHWVRKMLQTKNARKIIFITDACYSYPDLSAQEEMSGLYADEKVRDNVAIDLFFRDLGVVDIKSSSQGESSLALPGISLFTRELLNVLYAPSREYGATHWGIVMERVKNEVVEKYRRIRNQTVAKAPYHALASQPSQTPETFYPGYKYLSDGIARVSYSWSSSYYSNKKPCFEYFPQIYLHQLRGKNIQLGISFRDANNHQVRGRKGSKYNSRYGIAKAHVKVNVGWDNQYVSPYLFVPYHEMAVPYGTPLTPVFEVYDLTTGVPQLIFEERLMPIVTR